MKDLLQAQLLYDVIVEDEIDQVFNALPLMAPPPTLVNDIMAAVAQLPLPSQIPNTDSIWDNLDILHVSLQSQQLS
jgi:hypothetical protein